MIAKFFSCLVAAVALIASQYASAATISVGDHVAMPGDVIQVPVLIDAGGTADITFADLDFGIVGLPAIDITAVDRLTGTIWTSGVLSAVDAPSPAPGAPITPAIFSGTVSADGADAGTDPDPVTPTGVLLTYTVDTSGALPGTSYTLNPSVSGGSMIGNTNTGSIFAEVPGTVNGTLTIVPEPSTMLLSLLVACGFLARRRR